MSIYEDTFFMIYCCVLAGVFGAVLGSFLNCAAWRIAHGESFVKGRSHCTSCGHVLGFLDLIPVFSWIFLGGKCRYCKTKISPRYMLTELFFALVSVLTLLRFDLSPEFVRNMVLACCLFCLSLVDLEIFEIPNGCLLIPVIAWFVAIPFTEMSGMDVLYHVASGVGYGAVMLALVLLFDKILGKETMGGGDLKLFVVMGLYLGVAASLFALFFSCILGLIMGAIQKRGKENKGPQIPCHCTGVLCHAAVWGRAGELVYGAAVKGSCRSTFSNTQQNEPGHIPGNYVSGTDTLWELCGPD